MSKGTCRVALAALLVVLCWQPPALAADHMNLEEGLPVQVTDAYPIAYMGREVEGLVRYDRTYRGKDLVTLEPRIEYGLAPNAQVTLLAPFLVGTGDKTGSGDVVVDALYNFNAESLVVPAFALAAQAEFPTGRDTDGYVTTVKFIATKTISDWSLRRLHLNAAWRHNTDPGPDERQDACFVILGYSQPLRADTLLVADFVRTQERRQDETSNVLEMGLRFQWTPLTVLVAGVGAGVAEESPGFRATVGFQHSF